MVFLGTPFYGSAPAKYFDIIRSIVNLFTTTNKVKVHDLKEKSEKLGELVQSFTSRLHQRLAEGCGIEIQFFYETLSIGGAMV
jgi:hypothetical protein